MTEISEVAERVAARRAELDEEEKLLVEQLEKVRAEREDLAAAIRVWERMHAQLEAEKATTQAVPVQVGGRGVLLVPRREAGMEENALPPDYQQIMKIVRRAGGPVRVKDVGVELGLVSAGLPDTGRRSTPGQTPRWSPSGSTRLKVVPSTKRSGCP
jgi:hypothetical protein